ncbi:hypothetical protein ACHFCA_12185 [Delftia tsuruhatensis]
MAGDPKGHRHLDVVARALQSIRDSADTLADYAGTEAQTMGCGSAMARTSWPGLC